MTRIWLATIALWLLRAPPLAAHLMEHQHGSLNLVEQRGYLVLSVPVSALSGVDDNRDRRVNYYSPGCDGND
ncbi:MAG: hypothetical protein ACKODA_10080 [Nevskiaceae bacterium]